MESYCKQSGGDRGAGDKVSQSSILSSDQSMGSILDVIFPHQMAEPLSPTKFIWISGVYAETA